MSKSTGFEYRTTFAMVPSNFPNHEDGVAPDLAKISPKPPKGEDWQLAGTTSAQTLKGVVIFYFWERPAEYTDS